ncbi:NAD(P)-binding protein [Mollisia scopiformis]|uniref:NAD(P)-binding protein n=1 Tax=Mollisia scopiformis TaxID=149040 RepID=A0A194WUX2_MOLSC|nr:NAD(P)-binding protein [Mollisia scopiformis]KUJ11768.1 NAD(P)-binding protein [Mollisia scopiformis]
MAITHEEFGYATGALQAAKAFAAEIRGKIVVITGVSPNSIGSALALAVGSQGPKQLILASRTLANIQKVAAEIHSVYPDVNIDEVVLDLSNFQSIRQAAQRVKAIVGAGAAVDVLFNNAGINVSRKSLTETGVELQFATNHIGPFLFTNLLLPSMLQAKGRKRRVVNTASEAHVISPVRFSDINQEPGKVVPKDEQPRRGLPEGMLKNDGTYESSIAYGQSKTANVLFSVGLNARYASQGLKSFAVSPGNIMTNLVRAMTEEALQGFFAGIGDKWKNLDQGASTLVVAGFDPGLDEEAGVYVEDCQMKRPAGWASDSAKAERLWKLSEGLCGYFSASQGMARTVMSPHLSDFREIVADLQDFNVA